LGAHTIFLLLMLDNTSFMMSDPPSRLNCCLIGENAMRHSISIDIQGTHSISMLKCVIKKRMEPIFDAASEIHIWKVSDPTFISYTSMR
jgi:hypothetical protein